MAYTSPGTLVLLLPEIILIAAATLIYVVGAFSQAKAVWSWVAGTALLAAAVALIPRPDSPGFNGPVVWDGLAVYLRWLCLATAAFFVLMSAKSAAQSQAPEYVGSLLLVFAGAMLVAASSDLIMIFLGLELVSIPTYVLLYLGRRDAASQESTVKYFFLSIMSSAMMLYGFSFVYGVTGSTQLPEIYAALHGSANAQIEVLRQGALPGLALVLVFAGLGFKIAAAPFHFYAPDVYQGTTPGNAGLLAVAPKLAGIAAIVRVLSLSMGDGVDVAWRMALILAIMTMTVGNVLALWQDNIRRLLAYSSIAHAGYMLIGLAAAFAVGSAGQTEVATDGVAAAVFYLAVYALATAGVFAALVYLGSDERQIDGVDELAGLGRTHPGVALAIGVFMFSLAGVPPLAGFWGKFTLFFSALDVKPTDDPVLGRWFIILAVIGVLNAAIAAAYYMRIVGVMYFRAPLAKPAGEGGAGARFAALAAAVAVLFIGIFPGRMINGASDATAQARGFLQHYQSSEKVAVDVVADKESNGGDTLPK